MKNPFFPDVLQLSRLLTSESYAVTVCGGSKHPVMIQTSTCLLVSEGLCMWSHLFVPAVDLFPKEASVWSHASRADTRTSTLNLHFIPETKWTAFSSGDKLLLETSLLHSRSHRIASPPVSVKKFSLKITLGMMMCDGYCIVLPELSLCLVLKKSWDL